MHEKNTRNLGIILALMIILFILNNIFLFFIINNGKNNADSESKDIYIDKNNEILFRSKDEQIRGYAIYAFIVFCLVIIVFSAFGWMKEKNGKEDNSFVYT